MSWQPQGTNPSFQLDRRRLWTCAYRVSCECIAQHEAAAYGKRACLPVSVWGTSFPSLCLLKVLHAKFRTNQTKMQNSGWFVNALVRGCLLPRCFLPPDHIVCLPVIVLYRFLSSNVGMLKVECKCAKWQGSEQPGLAEDVPAHCRGCWTRWPLKVPSEPNYATILWFYETPEWPHSLNKWSTRTLIWYFPNVFWANVCSVVSAYCREREAMGLKPVLRGGFLNK